MSWEQEHSEKILEKKNFTPHLVVDNGGPVQKRIPRFTLQEHRTASRSSRTKKRLKKQPPPWARGTLVGGLPW